MKLQFFTLLATTTGLSVASRASELQAEEASRAWALSHKPRPIEVQGLSAPPELPEIDPTFPWPIITALLFAFASWGWLIQSQNHRLLLQWIRDARQSGWRNGAWEEWEELKLARGMESKAKLDLPHPDWNLLSPSEREVALLFSQGMSVDFIAEKLQCTRPHIYNLRSSIRQKWNMEKSEDLNLRIRSYLSAQ